MYKYLLDWFLRKLMFIQEMSGNDEEREGKEFELVSKAAQLGTLANC